MRVSIEQIAPGYTTDHYQISAIHLTEAVIQGRNREDDTGVIPFLKRFEPFK